MADGRHFEKKLKLPYLCDRLTDFPILMKFGMMTHIGPWQRINRKNFEFLKIQDVCGRRLE